MFVLLDRTTYHSLSQLSADHYQALQLTVSLECSLASSNAAQVDVPVTTA